MVEGPGGDASERPLLEIGRIARAHGLSGEVVVALITNRAERLAPGAEMTCFPPQVPPEPALAGLVNEPSRSCPPRPTAPRALEVHSSRFFKGRYLVEFVGVETREAAEALRGALLMAPPIEDGEALFVHDLVGMQVVDADGTQRGIVIAVQANPASDLLVMEDGNLVPLRFMVGKEEGRLVVDAPPGLFE
jgi:16S rRNA processing protein RimM